MTKNPFLNALGALAYILLIVGLINVISNTMGDQPDTFMAPIVMLSLLTLSVAVMAYVFFYQPMMLFIEGKKEQAMGLFVKTVGIFAAFTVVVLILLFSGLFQF